MESGTKHAAAAGLRELAREFVLAVAALTYWPILDERACGTAEQRARSTLFFPIVGLALGVLLAAADRGLGSLPHLPLAWRSLAVLLLATLATLALGVRGLADTVESLRLGA